MKKLNYAPFDGDGRRKVQPVNAPPGTQPIAVTNGTARMMIDFFHTKKSTTHSAQGGTVWVIWTWCLQQSIPFTLEVVPTYGFVMKPSTIPWFDVRRSDE